MAQFQLKDKDYSESGIKTLRAVGKTFLVACVTGAIVLLIASIMHQNIYYFVAAIAAILQGFAAQGICNAIAKITECQIYKQKLTDHQVVNKKQENEVENDTLAPENIAEENNNVVPTQEKTMKVENDPAPTKFPIWVIFAIIAAIIILSIIFGSR